MMQVRASGRGGIRRALTRRGDEGASAIELAVIAPVLLLLILMIIQYALYFQARQVAVAAAQDGARYARQDKAVDPGTWQAVAQQDAQKYYTSLSTSTLTGFSVQASYLPASNNVQVTVSGRMISLIGVQLPAVHASAQGPVECFRADDGNGGQQCAGS